MSMRRPGTALHHAMLSAIAVLAGLTMTWQSIADDAVATAPLLYKVEYEDADIRVLRVVYGPGEKSQMHEHPDSVAVYLTGGHIRITLPDGRIGEPHVPPGATMRHAAGRHAIENLGDTPFELVLVELKKKLADPPH